jgi:hypothetical protein
MILMKTLPDAVPKPLSVAVGTAIARRPPHRSRRALLTRRTPTSGHDVEPPVGIGVPQLRAWQPTRPDPHHLPPRQPVPLAASPQAAQPVPEQVVVEGVEGSELVGTA